MNNMINSEKEIIEMSSEKRYKYLTKLNHYIQNSYKLSNKTEEEILNECASFIATDKGSGEDDWNCPGCNSNDAVVINGTGFKDFSWYEHCICKKCGKFYKRENGASL